MQMAAKSMMREAKAFGGLEPRRLGPTSGTGVRHTVAIANRPIPTIRASPSEPSTATSGRRAFKATITPVSETPAKTTPPPPISNNMRKSSHVRCRSDILGDAAAGSLTDIGRSHQSLHHELSVVPLPEPLGLVFKPIPERVGAPAEVTYSPAVLELPHLLIRGCA